MWFNFLISRGLIPDSLLRRGVRGQGKQRLGMMKNSDLKKDYELFLKEASSGEIAVHTDDANNQHYEVDSEFFQYCLGKNLKYSSCYWNDDTSSLDEAEEIMLDLYCKRAKIKDGMTILDVGCGWGSLSLYLAQKYPRSKITGVSNSNSQRKFIEELAYERSLQNLKIITEDINSCLLYTSPSPRDRLLSRMPSSA